jgi:hypothetical protein
LHKGKNLAGREKRDRNLQALGIRKMEALRREKNEYQRNEK